MVMWKNYFAVGYKSVKNKKIFKKRKRKMASVLPLKTVPWEKKKKIVQVKKFDQTCN